MLDDVLKTFEHRVSSLCSRIGVTRHIVSFLSVGLLCVVVEVGAPGKEAIDVPNMDQKHVAAPALIALITLKRMNNYPTFEGWE